MWWQRNPSPDVEAAVARIPIFSRLSPRDLRSVAARCVLRRFEAGETIIEEGSVGLGCFIITGGRVEVFKTREECKMPLAVLDAGAVLGEMALLDGKPRSASVVALEDVECLLLSREGFRALRKHRPWFAKRIDRALPGRIRHVQDQLFEAKLRELALMQRLGQGGVAPAASSSGEAPAPERAVAGVEPAAGSDGSGSDGAGAEGSGTDVLRAPYALMMTGAVGFGESVRLVEVFFRSLDETSGLADGRPMGDVLRALPASLAAAGMSSWDAGRRLPSKLLGTFRDHLRSDWRGEDSP
jgi:CRP/FNR family transcriptional regulator, cyclic AMP receptor protein